MSDLMMTLLDKLIREVYEPYYGKGHDGIVKLLTDAKLGRMIREMPGCWQLERCVTQWIYEACTKNGGLPELFVGKTPEEAMDAAKEAHASDTNPTGQG